jgi:hypothetical protein
MPWQRLTDMPKLDSAQDWSLAQNINQGRIFVGF